MKVYFGLGKNSIGGDDVFFEVKKVQLAVTESFSTAVYTSIGPFSQES